MMEGMFEFMFFFIGLKALLRRKDDDDMGKRGKRKRKFNNNHHNDSKHVLDKESEALDLMSKKNNIEVVDKRKPFERVVLPPPREAQEGHI